MPEVKVTLDPHHVIKEGIKRVRQSSLSEAQICPSRVRFKSNDPTYYTGEARVLGTAYHAGLAALYEDRRIRQEAGIACGIEHGTLPMMIAEAISALDAEVESHELSVLAPFPWDTSYDSTLQLVMACLAHYIDSDLAWPAEWPVIAVEAEFALPGSFCPGLPEGWVVVGTTDLILLEPESGDHVIVDHKTAKRKWNKTKHLPQNTPQASWYSHWWPIAWAETHGMSHELAPATRFVYDVLVHQGMHFERREAVVTDASKQFVVESAAQLAGQLDAGGPWGYNPSAILCDARWCDYFEKCPGGAALHREA